MTSTIHLQEKNTLEDLFLLVFVWVDDYLKASVKSGHFVLPVSEQQKASYSELMTISLVGEWMKQRYMGDWFNFVKIEYAHLFPLLPDDTRYYRVLRNLERIFADLALIVANFASDFYVIDSLPLPICKGARWKRARAMTEASGGRYSLGKMYGFKLHGVINSLGMLGRFAIVGANEHDATVAKALFNEQDDKLRVLGDKGYVGTGIYAQLRDNAKNPYPWSAWLGRARKLIETTFSSLIRGKNMALGQLNSFWSIRAKVCRKIAAHNLAIVFLAIYP